MIEIKVIVRETPTGGTEAHDVLDITVEQFEPYQLADAVNHAQKIVKAANKIKVTCRSPKVTVAAIRTLGQKARENKLWNLIDDCDRALVGDANAYPQGSGHHSHKRFVRS